MSYQEEGGLYVICGLGNPGPRYMKNRHNVGFHCLDLLAEKWGLRFERVRFKAYLAMGTVEGRRVLLAKPLTFMNDSGESVAPLVRWHKVPPAQLLVIYDDLDLPLGKIRLRPGGSSGGHKGVASIIEKLGSADFPRLRIGIGRPERGDPVDYVLSDFTAEQRLVMEGAYTQAVAAVECFLREGIKEAMNRFN